jgi:hypothetical protein
MLTRNVNFYLQLFIQTLGYGLKLECPLELDGCVFILTHEVNNLYTQLEKVG